MDLNELHQREIDSLRDENIELRKKVQELEAKIKELESKNWISTACFQNVISKKITSKKKNF